MNYFPKQKNKDQDFKSYPDRNPNPIFTLDCNSELVYCNKAASGLLEICGSHAEQIIYPEGFTEINALAASTATIRKKVFQIDDYHYSFSFYPRETDGLVDVFGMDITEEVKHQTYFSIISSFTTALLNAKTEVEVARTITKEAISKLSFIDCVVYLVNRQTGTLEQKAAFGTKNSESIDETVHNPLILNFNEGVVGYAASEKKTIIVADVSKEKRYILDDEHRLSEIAVPIISGEEVIGVIDSEHPKKNYYSQEDAKILEAIASIAATRIQQIRAEKETELAQAKFQSFVENAFGGLYIHRNKKFEYVNEQLCEITGYSKAEMLDPSFDMQAIIVSADQNAIRTMKARHQGDNSPKSYQMEIMSKTGSIRQLSINTSVLTDNEDHVTLGIALDVTETIQSRYQLEEVIDALARRSEELNEFAHIASHNLRAPVTNLIGLLQHYNRADPSDSMNEMIMDKFIESVDQLNLTLEEMHQVLKIRAKASFDCSSVNLNELVNAIKIELSEKIRVNSFEIKTNFNIEHINYEKSHLKNLFLNLISNAIKYRREGISPMIKISSSKSDNQICLKFEDNGLGIDLAKHGNDIFGMYKRFHSIPEGRGMGLYLVKRQLNALGGSITVKSELNVGTCFSVLLNSR